MAAGSVLYGRSSMCSIKMSVVRSYHSTFWNNTTLHASRNLSSCWYYYSWMSVTVTLSYYYSTTTSWMSYYSDYSWMSDSSRNIVARCT